MFLGIDLGTSGVKAVVTGADGALVAQASAPLAVSYPRSGWAEQDPADWWHAAELAVAGLPAEIRAGVRGIGLAGQMHGATLLDAADRPLRPAILWNDGRSGAECAELEWREPRARAITGNLAMPGFTAPKLLWVAEHEPALFERTASVLLPKDYVRLCMTGDKASDMSDSAGTLWLDVGARRWSDAMLAATGLGVEHMPRLYEGSEPTGVLRAEVARRWGMPRVPVAAGAGDNAAGAIGVGVIAEGDALLSLGTSGVIFVATDRFRPNPADAVHAFCHCLPGLWHQMAVHLSAASCADWAAVQLGLAGPTALFELAVSSPPDEGEELFLPYLGGERTPHNDPAIRATWLGLSHQTTPARLARAVLEGVAFAFADGLAALGDAGTQAARLTVIGGGARSRLWGEVIAAALGRPLDYLEGGEVGPALGAARLARMAVTGEDEATVCRRPPVRETLLPDPAQAARLAPKLARFRAAYPALKLL